ncbi:MAG: hypothetical protein H6658_07355 [Ardenticatenaceae bacterium]|nr:hypothetical protein [Ardenticatenaceae bacterium]
MLRWLRNLFLILVGLTLGAGLGLLVGWVIWPTEYTDATPIILQDAYRQDYLRMIAAAYGEDGDLETAVSRLESLGANGADQLFSLMLDDILAGSDEAEIRQLVKLAAALGYTSPAMQPYLPEPES